MRSQRTPSDEGLVSSVVVDDSDFPVVVIRFVGAPDVAAFRRFLDEISGLLKRNQPFVTVVDARNGGLLPFMLVKEAAAWLRANGKKHAAFSRGSALVLPGPVQRAVLAAVLRLAPLGNPYEVFDDVDEAVVWAVTMLHRPLAMSDR